MPTVLVTGGTGFVGSAVLSALATAHPDWHLISADIRPPLANAPSKNVILDVRDANQVEQVFDQLRPEVIVHTAGIVPKGAARYNRVNEKAVRELNVGGTENIVSAAKRAGVKALVFTSSCCVITDDYAHEYLNYDESTPVPERSLVYGESKATAESLILTSNTTTFHTCAIRPSVILGPGDYQLIPALHACIAKRETPYLIGTGRNLYDFTYISNVADAHVLAVENLLTSRTAVGLVFNISNGQPVTFRDFCLAVWAGFGHVPFITVRIPSKAAWVAGLVSEIFTWASGSPSTLSRGSINDAVGARYANIERARRVLGYVPRVGLDEGVKLSCEAYKKVLNAGVAEKIEKSARDGNMNGTK